MPASKDIIVIGAGIIGASIAWHLTKAGAKVTIVEAASPGGVATANSFAWLNASWGNPKPYFRLRTRSLAEWTRLASECPGIQLGWVGGLLWDMPRDQLEAYAAEHGSWGYGIRRIDRAEAAQLEPNLAAPPDFALYVAEEGAVEPVSAARALTDDALRGGARLISGAPVASLVSENGRVVGIRTADATVRADEVVLAAGTASPELAATVGVNLPLDTPPGVLVHSHPHSKLLNGLVLADRAHIRQTAEGRIVAGADFGGADPGADVAGTARALFAEAQAMLKGGDALSLDFHTLGYRPTPADGFPIIGRADNVAGLYIAVMHSGITLAPVVGLFATEELLDGRRDPLLAPYGLSRFAQ
jgi:glycine/D-amino acid oxidase-like deaminating enzyme